MLFLILCRNRRLICNAHLMIFIKDLNLQFYKNISRLELQMDLIFLDKVWKSINDLNLKSQVIWSGESKDIHKFLKHVSHFQTIEKPSNMYLNIYFSLSKQSLNTILLHTKNSLWIFIILLEVQALIWKGLVFGKVDLAPPFKNIRSQKNQ